MRHIVTLAFSILTMGIGAALLILGRHSIGSSTPLLIAIVGFFVVGIGSAFPTDTIAARDQAVSWYKAWKGQ